MLLSKSISPEAFGIGTFLERIRDAAIIADAKTQQIVLWNPAATKVFGYSTSEALKLSVEALIPEHLKAKHRAEMARYAETDRRPYIDLHKPLELPALKKGGEEIHVELSLSTIGLVGDTNGGGCFVLAIVRDITERKRAEEELKRQAQLFELANDAIIVRNLEGKISFWNRSAEETYGWKKEEALGQISHELLETRFPEPLEEIQRELVCDGRWRGELEHTRRDGTRIVVASRWALRKDESDEAGSILELNTDITECEREERLREVNRHLSELASLRVDFTAMVAHEIGSPLATIRGFLDMLTTGELNTAEQADILAKTQAETERLSTLVADVRSAAAIERDGFALMLRRTSVDELLEDATRFAETLPGGHPLVVEVATEERVWTDRYRIGQVLRNLLSNAAKYSPDGAPIELRVMHGKTPGRVWVEVADHGCGVHPDDVERIFEKFGRGRDGSGQKAYGVGMGLYIARRIVQAHGSDLTLDSTSGSGSVFGLELEVTQ